MDKETTASGPAGDVQGAPDTPDTPDTPAAPGTAAAGAGAGKGGGRRGIGRAGGRGGGKKGLRAGNAGPQGPARVAGEAVQTRPAPEPVQPLASPARMKRRHWGLFASFVLLVLAPLAAIIFYLWTFAIDQYSSTTGFIVRQEESGGASELLGGLVQFAGGTAASDGDILYEFIQSQEIVEAVDARVDLRAHYSAPWPDDWVFAIWPDATLEDLVWYWQRIVRISYDQSTGLIEVRVLAFAPEVARQITRAIVRESQDRINALNTQAREDAMRYAREDLDEAITRLKAAREALTQFRIRTRIVDPAADIQARMGVMTNLQQQLAEALIEYDLLRGTALETDPRLTKGLQRIEVIRERIAAERLSFASDGTEVGGLGEDYPTLIAEFESLSVDREFAEETYRAALTALAVARADAVRQSRYLATYIQPTLSQSSEYPQRIVLSALAGLFLLLAWSIIALIYYSIRDRS